MPRLKFTVAYEGTRYAGWQLQAGAPDRNRPPTIQGELERVFHRVAGERLVVHGSGRTDAGVHAEAQICHVDMPEHLSRVHWLRALNSKLPPDIRVLACDDAPDTFHARKSAKGKRYAYTLWAGPGCAVPRISAFAWSLPVLDLERIAAAIPYLIGEHDFASFQNTGTRLANTTRRIFSITCKPGEAANLICPASWPVVSYVFEGNGFLKQMVRNLMGLLVWIGQGRLEPEDIPAILAARERCALPSPTAPACGLTLLEVVYQPVLTKRFCSPAS